MNQLEIVQSALSYVLDRSADEFVGNAKLRELQVDSIALVCMADVVEERHPEIQVPNDVLRFAETVSDLAAGLVSRNG